MIKESLKRINLERREFFSLEGVGIEGFKSEKRSLKDY